MGEDFKKPATKLLKVTSDSKSHKARTLQIKLAGARKKFGGRHRNSTHGAVAIGSTPGPQGR